MEAACGVGLVLGPTIGSAIFSFAKYQWTFYIFGIIIFSNVIWVAKAMPNKLNKSVNERMNNSGENPHDTSVPNMLSFELAKSFGTSERIEKKREQLKI